MLVPDHDPTGVPGPVAHAGLGRDGGRSRSGRGLDGERQPRTVAGRRQPERLRRGGDRPPVRRTEGERARRAVARGRDLDVDRALGPRGEEPHLGEGPQGHRRDHVEPPGRLALLGGLHGYVGDLQGLAADLESVLDREGRRVLGLPDQSGIDLEEADGVLLAQPVRLAERGVGRQRLVHVAGGGPPGRQVDRLVDRPTRERVGDGQPADGDAGRDRRRVPQMQYLARHDFGPGDGRLDHEPETALDRPVELAALLGHEGVGGERGEPLADRQQAGHARGGVLRVELRDRLVGQLRDLGPAREAGPGRVDAVHDVFGRRLAAQERERVGARAAPPRPPKLPKP